MTGWATLSAQRAALPSWKPWTQQASPSVARLDRHALPLLCLIFHLLDRAYLRPLAWLLGLEAVHHGACRTLSSMPLACSIKGASTNGKAERHEPPTSVQVACLDSFAPASIDDLCTIHERNYVLGLEQLIARRGAEIVDSSPTYVTSSSFQDALKVTSMHGSFLRDCCRTLNGCREALFLRLLQRCWSHMHSAANGH